MVAIDGSNFEIPDETANAAAIGYPGSRNGDTTVRVIEHALPGVPDAQARYRLLATLLDPVQAPALLQPQPLSARQAFANLR